MKTVTFDDEAYELLRAAKLTPKESFSKVVKRTFGGAPTWKESAGGWSHWTDEDVRALRKETVDDFGRVGDK